MLSLQTMRFLLKKSSYKLINLPYFLKVLLILVQFFQKDAFISNDKTILLPTGTKISVKTNKQVTLPHMKDISEVTTRLLRAFGI